MTPQNRERAQGRFGTAMGVRRVWCAPLCAESKVD